MATNTDIILLGGVVGTGILVFTFMPSIGDITENLVEGTTSVAAGVVLLPLRFGQKLGDVISKQFLGYQLTPDEFDAEKTKLESNILTPGSASYSARQFYSLMRYDLECSKDCVWANAEALRQMILSYFGEQTSTQEFRNEVIFAYAVLYRRNLINDIDLYEKSSGN